MHAWHQHWHGNSMANMQVGTRLRNNLHLQQLQPGCSEGRTTVCGHPFDAERSKDSCMYLGARITH